MGVGRGAQVGNLHLELNFGASVDVGRIFFWYASGPGIPPTLDSEEGEAFYDMRNKIVRRLPSWEQSGVVSQQRLRLRRLTLVKRVSKGRFEYVLFLFLACFPILYGIGKNMFL